jgi:predicted metal-dependent hydrolase
MSMATHGAGKKNSPGKKARCAATPLDAAAAARLLAAMLDVPTPVSVRISRRASGVILRMLPGTGLEIVVPAGCSLDLLPLAVESRRAWIEDAAARLAASGELPGMLPVALPQRVVLTAFGLEYRVEYVSRRGTQAARPGAVVREMGPGRLAVALPGGDAGAGADAEAMGREAAQRGLREFVRAKAGPLLVAGLREVSREVGLAFAAASVRRQRTRWGSCSRGGRVSLNLNLAFLPWELARYVFIHELCHTRHPDHSARFWDAVQAILPESRELDAALRHAGHYVPLWFSRGVTGP